MVQAHEILRRAGGPCRASSGKAGIRDTKANVKASQPSHTTGLNGGAQHMGKSPMSNKGSQRPVSISE